LGRRKPHEENRDGGRAKGRSDLNFSIRCGVSKHFRFDSAGKFRSLG
jgi:hypothetical protein